MSQTEATLVEVYKAPVIRLDAICEQYLNNAYEQARRKAHLNQLPFPVFQTEPSKKSPWLVHVRDFAKFLDERAEKASQQWERSQV